MIIILYHNNHFSIDTSNHQYLECLFNILFGLTTYENPKSALLSFLRKSTGWPVYMYSLKWTVNRKAFHWHHIHDDVIKWKHFPGYWPFVMRIHRWPVDCPHKGRWRGALMFSLICAWTNGWENNRHAGDLSRLHYDVTGMFTRNTKLVNKLFSSMIIYTRTSKEQRSTLLNFPCDEENPSPV